VCPRWLHALGQAAPFSCDAVPRLLQADAPTEMDLTGKQHHTKEGLLAFLKELYSGSFGGALAFLPRPAPSSTMCRMHPLPLSCPTPAVRERFSVDHLPLLLCDLCARRLADGGQRAVSDRARVLL
jgi:hypothetical protein